MGSPLIYLCNLTFSDIFPEICHVLATKCGKIDYVIMCRYHNTNYEPLSILDGS